MGMTLVRFHEAVNAFIKYQNFSNKLYEIGMAADDCPIWNIGFSYLKLIADVMGQMSVGLSTGLMTSDELEMEEEEE